MEQSGDRCQRRNNRRGATMITDNNLHTPTHSPCPLSFKVTLFYMAVRGGRGTHGGVGQGALSAPICLLSPRTGGGVAGRPILHPTTPPHHTPLHPTMAMVPYNFARSELGTICSSRGPPGMYVDGTGRFPENG